jgi:translation initiation factor eIF-2B subunit alpha
MQKPFYALAESYKFLRHYPLSQTDLPRPITEGSQLPLAFPTANTQTGQPTKPIHQNNEAEGERGLVMTSEMERLNPLVDVTPPDLIDFIITDLGAPLSPTSVSQYLVAQFSS